LNTSVCTSHGCGTSKSLKSSNLYNMKWQLLTDKDPDAIHHATNYVNNAKKELEEKIEMLQISWDLTDEELEEIEELLSK
jgi:uncharacterized alpha/beta hydrolase family protein